MSLSSLVPTDTRHFFRPVSSALVVLLRGLGPDDWQRRTIAGSWVVRDVLAHILDVTCRRVSFHRDGLTPPPPPFPIESDRDFVRFINTINHEWVRATRRLSPQVLIEVFHLASADLADLFEALPLEAPALFPVSWAGESSSAGWFDVGREFTELWHHQEQIRRAVGAPSLPDPRYLHAVLEIALRGLPHAYRDVSAGENDAMTIDVSGPAGGMWTLRRDKEAWSLWQGRPDRSTAQVQMSDDAAWRLLFNALDATGAAAEVRMDGSTDLALPLLRARSVIV
jgi:uncharacterized protein (TIGR03083 family)